MKSVQMKGRGIRLNRGPPVVTVDEVAGNERERDDRDREPLVFDRMRVSNVLDAFERDPGGGGDQQEGFKERRKRLDLAVPVGVVFVGRRASDTHRDKQNRSRDEIQKGMDRLGEYANRSREKRDAELERGERDRRGEREGSGASAELSGSR